MAIEPPPPPARNLGRWAHFYDAIYAARGKRYELEAAQLAALAGPRRTWLDVACGTGEHLRHLRNLGFEVAGVDACPEMLAVAEAKLPGAPLSGADMTSMRLGRQFDVVSCLFASIAYLPDAAAVSGAVHRMAEHLRPGGLIVIEPGLAPGQVRPPTTDRLTVDLPGGRLERIATARHAGSRLLIRFGFTLHRRDRIERFSDEHRITLFPAAALTGPLRAAGLDVETATLDARPLYMGFSSTV